MKKLYLLVLALVLMLSLAACGEDTGSRVAAVSDEYKSGLSLLGEGKYEEAITAFTEAIAKEPDSDRPYIGRGDAYTGLEKAAEALADYQAAIGLYKSEEAYLGAVNAYILMNDFDAALEMAQNGIKAVKSDALDAKKAALEKGNAVDSQGREHKITHYDGEDKVVWVHITEYEDGRISVKTSYNGSGAQTGRYEYTYNANGDSLMSSWYFWSDGKLMPRERKYDEQNREIEIIGYGVGSVTTNRDVIEYGPDGKKSKSTYWADITREDDWGVTLYEWTDFDKLSVLRVYDKNDVLQDYTVYEYDGRQLLEKMTCYKADDSVWYSYTYEYNASGKMIREHRYDENGKLVGTTEY